MEEEKHMKSVAEQTFPTFSLARLLSTIFEPTQGLRVVTLIDLDDPQEIEAILVDDQLAAFFKNLAAVIPNQTKNLACVQPLVSGEQNFGARIRMMN